MSVQLIKNQYIKQIMKRLLRTFRDSTNGRVYTTYYNTVTGDVTEVDHTTGKETHISDSCWHACGR